MTNFRDRERIQARIKRKNYFKHRGEDSRSSQIEIQKRKKEQGKKSPKFGKFLEEKNSCPEYETPLSIKTTQFTNTYENRLSDDIPQQVDELEIPGYITKIKNQFSKIYLDDESKTLCLISRNYSAMLKDKGIILPKNVEGLENLIEEDELTVQFVEPGKIKEQILTTYGVDDNSDLAFIFKEAPQLITLEGVTAKNGKEVSSLTGLDLPSEKYQLALNQIYGTVDSRFIDGIDEENTFYAMIKNKTMD